jgi:enoyl-CoA hydratase/carnithine racemase
LPDFLNTAAAYQALMHHTKDHHEALAAFLEKRNPMFLGN